MAKMYTSIDSYVNEMKGQFPEVNATFGGEGSRIDADSGMRNYLAEQLQRLEDNDFTLSGDAKEFYASLGADSKDGFANLSASKIGGRELTAITYAMMQLDKLQTDGKISVDDYAGYVNELMSKDNIGEIAASGDNKSFMLFEEINRQVDNPVDDVLKKQNASDLAIGTRPYINDVGDYLRSARTADPSRAPFAEKPEGYSLNDELSDLLAEAEKNELITHEQYVEASNGLRDVWDQHGDVIKNIETSASKQAMLFAMQDVIALGDKDLAAELMSPEGFDNIIGQTGNAEGVDLLRKIENERVHAESKPETHNGNPETGHDGQDTEDPNAGKDDKPVAPFDKEERAAVMDKMTENYFAKSEADGGLTMDDYAEHLSAYENLSGDEADQYYETHPDFAEANAFMDRLDKLEADISNGTVYINVVKDIDGGSDTYGLSYPDSDAEITDVERAKAEYGDEFLAGLNAAANQVADPNYQLDGPDAGGAEGKDLDAGIDQIDFNILSRQSPAERMQELQSAAIAVWRGDYGSGSARIEALEAAGYDADARKQIQDMVNMGDEWCRNMTMEDFDKAFPPADGTSIADQEAAFQAERAQAAAYVMTYESPEDLKAAWDVEHDVANPMSCYSPLDAEAAAQYYDQAAHILDGAYAGGAEPDVTAEESMESAGNLAGYVAENPEAGFETTVEELNQRAAGEPEVTDPDDPKNFDVTPEV